MLKKINELAKKIAYVARVLDWAAHSLATFPIPDWKEKEPERGNDQVSVSTKQDTPAEQVR
jgi:hypothetical protein